MWPPTNSSQIADWNHKKVPNEAHRPRVSVVARGRRGASRRKKQRSNLLLQENQTSSEMRPPKGPRQIADQIYQKVPNETVEGVTKCHDTIKVNSSSNKQAHCPDACPYFAQDKTNARLFRCVASAEECKAMNPQTPVADKKMGICRSPMVESCREHHYNGTDACKICHRLYALGPDGKCHSQFKCAVCGLGMVSGVLFIFIGAWMMDCSRNRIAARIHCRRRRSSVPIKNCEPLYLHCRILGPHNRAFPAPRVLGAPLRKGKARS